jgi:hypothetical protein
LLDNFIRIEVHIPLNTSYFSKYKGVFGVSIALTTPSWFTGRRYPALAPTPHMLSKYLKDKDRAYFKLQYWNNILCNLDAQKVYNDLGNNSVLLCHEIPSEFCHRHIVTYWLEYVLDIRISEL